MKKVISCQILTFFPRSPVRKILAPGEEENLELEAEDDAAAGAGSTETFPPRAPGMAFSLLWLHV